IHRLRHRRLASGLPQLACAGYTMENAQSTHGMAHVGISGVFRDPYCYRRHEAGVAFAGGTGAGYVGRSSHLLSIRSPESLKVTALDGGGWISFPLTVQSHARASPPHPRKTSRHWQLPTTNYQLLAPNPCPSVSIRGQSLRWAVPTLHN